MGKTRHIAVVLMLVVLLGAAALPTLAQQNGIIANASRVNLRSGPGAGFPVVTVLANGQQVSILSRNADTSWVQVQLITGVSGWVNARYVVSEAVPDVNITASTGRNSAVVTTDFLNVRTGPGANFARVAQLAQGQTMDLTGRNADNTWVQMRVPGGAAGWVSAHYIAPSTQIGSLPIASNTGVTPGFTPPQSYGFGQTGVVTATGLNVRYGPGLDFNRFATLNNGASVSLVGRSGNSGWLLVQLANGSSGWVNAGFIATSYPIADLPVRG